MNLQIIYLTFVAVEKRRKRDYDGSLVATEKIISLGRNWNLQLMLVLRLTNYYFLLKWNKVLEHVDSTLAELKKMPNEAEGRYLTVFVQLLAAVAFQELNGRNSIVPEKFRCDPANVQRSGVSQAVQRNFPIQRTA